MDTILSFFPNCAYCQYERSANVPYLCIAYLFHMF
nr:MAG TPA: hypothetical protein [Caudoviricetes sp.]